jgi:hypothetical protein
MIFVKRILFFSFAAQATLAPVFALTSKAVRVSGMNSDAVHASSRASRSFAVNTSLSKYKDTHAELPSFQSKEEYEAYLMEASGLPKGFATGSAVGSFVPEEAPLMGSLPIKGTIIHLTDGPSENWAAVFTQNKVREAFLVQFLHTFCWFLDLQLT